VQDEERQPGEYAAAKGFVRIFPDRLRERFADFGKPVRSEYGKFDQKNRERHEPGSSDMLDQAGGDGRAKKSAQRRAGGENTEQPFALGAVEDVDDKGPEDGNHEEVEYRNPDEESPADPHLPIRWDDDQKHGEYDEVGGKETVGDGDEPIPGKPAHDIGKQGTDQKHGQQRAGEKPGQVVHPADDHEFIPDRTQNIVGEKKRHDIGH
jgi:hypothetical protein